jgi:hypothetical protein
LSARPIAAFQFPIQSRELAVKKDAFRFGVPAGLDKRKSSIGAKFVKRWDDTASMLLSI